MKPKSPNRSDPVQILPTLDRILVERSLAPSESAGGIHIPDTARERMKLGTIIARGDQVKSDRLEIGATVLFGEHAGIQTPLSGRDLLIMDEGEILGIIQ